MAGAASAVAGLGASVVGKVAESAASAAAQGTTVAKDRAESVAAAATEGAKAGLDRAKAKKSEFKATVKAWLLEIIYEQVEKLVERGPRMIKHGLYDPDKPQWAERLQDSVVEKMWPDIREEIMWEVAATLDGKKKTQAEEGPGSCCCLAFLRYHIYPFDKGLWGRLRDWVWIVFTLGSLIPVSGFYSLVYLFLFLIIDRGDEFQLLQYILQFKGTQFISHGVIRTVLGFFSFVNCVSAGADDREHSCEANGPGTAELYPGMYEMAVFGWVLQVVLVWAAYCFLRNSSEKGRRELKGRIGEKHVEEGGVSKRDFVHTGAEAPGGYIKYFLIYDAVCFTIVVLGLFIVIALRPGGFTREYNHWSIKHAFFASQVIYGFLSMPFFIFLIPVLQRFLTHALDTAYDKEGRTVSFAGPEKPKDDDDKSKRWGAIFNNRSATQDLSNRMPEVNEKLEALYGQVMESFGLKLDGVMDKLEGVKERMTLTGACAPLALGPGAAARSSSLTRSDGSATAPDIC